MRRLFVRKDLRQHGVDLQLLGDRVRHRLRVPGHHHHFDPRLVQPTHRLVRLGAYRVSDRKGRERPLTLDEIDHRLSTPRRRLRELRERRRRLHTQLRQQVRPTGRELASLHRRTHTATGNRFERSRGTRRNPPVRRALHDGARHRMLGIVFDGSRKRQRVVL